MEILVPQLEGRRLSRQGIFEVVRANAAKAGIPKEKVSPHVLRHSAATHMVEAGGPPDRTRDPGSRYLFRPPRSTRR